ncbi:MAG: DUF502 domain-containing protein [Candidatus Bipolaricaulota bacterium]
MRRFILWLRATFLSGLLALLPLGATVYIVWGLYALLDGLMGRGRPIGDAIERAIGREIPGLGIVVLVALVLTIGVITRNIVGRTVHEYFERLFFSVPGVRRIYGTLKQFAGALLGDDGAASFSRVVMFEYPKPGVYALGLVTNEHLGKLEDVAGEECVMVYLPTVPNPLSGLMLVVPRRLVQHVDMGVEEALSMIVSSGSVLPDRLTGRATDPSAEAQSASRRKSKRKG